MLRAFNTNFTTTYDTYKPTAEVAIKKLNENYIKAAAEWQ